MRIFISGGCKNGKSYFAQKLAVALAEFESEYTVPLYYIATMTPVDAEDHKRIDRHRRERDGWGFITVEQAERIEGILQTCDTEGAFLVDSLTALLANEMFPPDGPFDNAANDRVAAGLSKVLSSVGRLVIVSDFLYGDAAVYGLTTELFRKSLAQIDRIAAEVCDVVLEVTFSGIIVHKGREVFDGIYNEIA